MNSVLVREISRVIGCTLLGIALIGLVPWIGYWTGLAVLALVYVFAGGIRKGALLYLVVVSVTLFIGSCILRPLEFLCLALAIVWVARVLATRPRGVHLLLDLGLMIVGTGFAFWAFGRTGSFIAACWVFFVTQAIAPWLGTSSPAKRCRFSQAQTAAERALAALERGRAAV